MLMILDPVRESKGKKAL